MPLCDSSETYMRAVRPKPSPAELRPGLTADISEVSRFSCMKFLGVSGVFDYAGLIRNSRYRPCSCCLPRIYTASASGLYLFASPSPTPPILYLRFTASLTVATQDSRPSGSLLLSRKALSSSTFMVYPGAHKFRLHALADCGHYGLPVSVKFTLRERGSAGLSKSILATEEFQKSALFLLMEQ